MTLAHTPARTPRRTSRPSRAIAAAVALLVTAALALGGALPATAAENADELGVVIDQVGSGESAPAGVVAAIERADAQGAGGQGPDATVGIERDATSMWSIRREGLGAFAWGFTPSSTVTVSLNGAVAGQVTADDDGEVRFTFTAQLAAGTYTLQLASGSNTGAVTFRIVADSAFYSASWIASFDPGMSASRDVVSLAELAATPVDIDGWDFPDSFSDMGPTSVDLLLDGTAVDTLFTDTLGDVEAQLAGPLTVGTHQVTLTSPIGSASVTLVVVPNTQGTKPRAGEHRGSTLQTHAGSSEQDDPKTRPFSFTVDGSGRLTGLTGEYWWYCRGGHGSGFDDWSTSEFPATPITVDRPFEIHWSDISMNYIIVGIVRADGSASGTLYASLGVCGSTVQTFTTQLTGTTPQPPTDLPTPQRLSGDNRYATSVEISQSAFPGRAPVVYLASGTSFPDGLSAGPAAAHQGGPVLLTPRSAVPQVVLDEIRRLNPARVVIVGGTPSVSAHVASQVAGLPGKPAVTRLGGADRFATSRLVAAHAFPDGAPAAFVATGLKFPDALTAGPAAALRDGPVLLVHGSQATLDAATRATLRDLEVDWVGIAGDTNSVTAGIATGIDAVVPSVQRFAGANRYATAALIAGQFSSADSVLVASGLGFADALPGAAAAGAAGAPMLLSSNRCVPDVSITAMQRLQPDAVVLLGGTPTLSAAVASYTRC